jgi:cytochrome c5
MRRVVVLVALLVGLAACGAAAPAVTPGLVTVAQRRWADTSADELSRGRQLLTTRCTACHGLRDPADHGPAEWEFYLKEMGQRAHLDTAEAQALQRYVLSAREPLPAKP